MESVLFDVTISLFACTCLSLVFSWLKKPPMLGYIASGILLKSLFNQGIFCLDSLRVLGELGLLSLMFTVGLDMSVKKFKQIYITSFQYVGLQLMGAAVISYAGMFFFDLKLSHSVIFILLIFIFLLTLNSTAVALKMLENKKMRHTEDGSFIISILIAQDLLLILMIIIANGMESNTAFSLLIVKIFIAIVSLAIILYLLDSKYSKKITALIEKIIHQNKELTMLFSITFCCVFSFVFEVIGLSAAYGAFIGGMILRNAHENSNIPSLTKPLSNFLMIMFFLYIGASLDFAFIYNHLVLISCISLFVIIFKTLLNICIAAYFQRKNYIIIGLMLANMSEFCFILLESIHNQYIFDIDIYKLSCTLIIISLSFGALAISTMQNVLYRYTTINKKKYLVDN